MLNATLIISKTASDLDLIGQNLYFHVTVT